MSDSKFFSRVASLSVLGLLIASANGVAATCSQKDLTGTWDFFLTFKDQHGYQSESEEKCVIALNRTGGVKTKSSSCKYRGYDEYLNLDTKPDKIGGGAIKVSTKCDLTGKIKLCSQGLCANIKILWGRMSRDKIDLSGLMYVVPKENIVVKFHSMKR